MQMTSIPGPHIVSVAESEEDGDGVGDRGNGDGIGDSANGDGIGDSANGDGIDNSEHASMKAHAGDPSVASVERSTIIQANANAQHTPINLQVYDYAISEAANVIDQLGWKTKKLTRRVRHNIPIAQPRNRHPSTPHHHHPSSTLSLSRFAASGRCHPTSTGIESIPSSSRTKISSSFLKGKRP